MRSLVLITALGLAGCKGPGYVDLKVTMACANLGPLPPGACSHLFLDCANRLDVRIYQASDGKPGDILSTRCVPMSELGQVTTLCDVLSRSPAATLLSDLPNGKKVMVRLRALYVLNPSRSDCNDDLPGEPDPVLLFDGFSDAITLDGTNHELHLRVSTCGSCSFLPPACLPPPPPMTCAPLKCEAPKVPASYPGAPTCCPTFCKTCDDPPDGGCHPPPECDAGSCGPPPVCPGGLRPLKPPGACCPVCPELPAPPQPQPQ